MINTSRSKRAIVIGAGIGGLAVAIRLKKMGYDVLVFEANENAGGKATEYVWQDFRFDCGPSLFTLPALVDELWTLCNKNPRTYFEYESLKIVTKYFYENNITIDSYSSPKLFAQEVKKKIGVEECVVLDFLSQQEKTYNKIAPVFLENAIHKWSKIFRWKMFLPMLHLMQFKFLQSLNTINQNYFKHPALVRLFNRYGTYNGSNPYKMPSLFNIISHLEHNVGAYMPSNGIHAIPKTMYQLAVEEGVQFYFKQRVDKIIQREKNATAIVANGQTYHADVVVSNMDVQLTYEKLLPDFNAPKKYLNNEISTSALIFQWALSLTTPSLEVHNILFAEDYEKEFEYLFSKKEFYHDPTIYIYISSKIVSKDAPSGKENWFVMINAPHLTQPVKSIDTAAMRTIILNKIKHRLNIDIEKHIEHEHIIEPKDIESNTNTYLGSLYGASSNSLMSAFWRHPNFSQIKNLYFCGGTVHPGGGIPLCLLSAKITAGLIDENHSQ